MKSRKKTNFFKMIGESVESKPHKWHRLIGKALATRHLDVISAAF